MTTTPTAPLTLDAAPEIAAIREALDAGPTPGTWYIGAAHTDDEGYVELPIAADINGKTATAAVVCLQFPRVPGMQDANAKHIVACSPAAMTAVLATIAQLEEDARRLDFILKHDAFKHATRTDSGGVAYQLMAQDEDENYTILSGADKFFPNPRAAIDAAIAAHGKDAT